MRWPSVAERGRAWPSVARRDLARPMMGLIVIISITNLIVRLWSSLMTEWLAAKKGPESPGNTELISSQNLPPRLVWARKAYSKLKFEDAWGRLDYKSGSNQNPVFLLVLLLDTKNPGAHIYSSRFLRGDPVCDSFSSASPSAFPPPPHSHHFVGPLPKANFLCARRIATPEDLFFFYTIFTHDETLINREWTCDGAIDWPR